MKKEKREPLVSNDKRSTEKSRRRDFLRLGSAGLAGLAGAAATGPQTVQGKAIAQYTP